MVLSPSELFGSEHEICVMCWGFDGSTKCKTYSDFISVLNSAIRDVWVCEKILHFPKSMMSFELCICSRSLCVTAIRFYENLSRNGLKYQIGIIKWNRNDERWTIHTSKQGYGSSVGYWNVVGLWVLMTKINSTFKSFFFPSTKSNRFNLRTIFNHQVYSWRKSLWFPCSPGETKILF